MGELRPCRASRYFEPVSTELNVVLHLKKNLGIVEKYAGPMNGTRGRLLASCVNDRSLESREFGYLGRKPALERPGALPDKKAGQKNRGWGLSESSEARSYERTRESVTLASRAQKPTSMSPGSVQGG
ncbi:hypothetical protein KM043_010254 [Ampulex compressa]|nr:hypothetical protein KM043_010254 [Ampulex compressa]